MDDQIDLNKAAENVEAYQKAKLPTTGPLSKEAFEDATRRCACGRCGLPRDKKVMDKTPQSAPLANPMDKVAEDLFDDE